MSSEVCDGAWIWIERNFKHEEFEGKERFVTENWTPWQTDGGETRKNAVLVEETSSVEPVPIVLIARARVRRSSDEWKKHKGFLSERTRRTGPGMTRK